MNEELEKIKFEFEKGLKVNIENFVNEIDKIRGARINLSSIRNINVDNSGLKISHISNIFSSQNQLTIEPFEKKNSNLIIKSIVESNLGYKFDKTIENKIYFSLMPLNQEIKKKIIIFYKEKVENAKTSIRKLRLKLFNSVKNMKLNFEEEKRFKKKIDQAIKLSENDIIKIYELKSSILMEV